MKVAISQFPVLIELTGGVLPESPNQEHFLVHFDVLVSHVHSSSWFDTVLDTGSRVATSSHPDPVVLQPDPPEKMAPELLQVT